MKHDQRTPPHTSAQLGVLKKDKTEMEINMYLSTRKELNFFRYVIDK